MAGTLRGIFSKLLVITMIKEGSAFLGIPDFIELGYCADVTLMRDFDPVKYQGLWFDIQRVPNEYEHAAQCISQNYTWNGTSINVSLKGLSESGERASQSAVMIPRHSEEEPGKVENLADFLVYAVGVPEAPYKVIFTDYVSVSCVYSCLDYYGAFKAEFAWIISRSENLHKKSTQKCLNLFSSFDIDVDKLTEIRQGESCSYEVSLEEERNRTKLHFKTVLSNLSMPVSAQNEERNTVSSKTENHELITTTANLINGAESTIHSFSGSQIALTLSIIFSIISRWTGSWH